MIEDLRSGNLGPVGLGRARATVGTGDDDEDDERQTISERLR